MKKLVGFLTMALVTVIFIWVPSVEAKQYRPLSYAAYIELPDDTILPDYISRLEMAEFTYEMAADGKTLTNSKYRDRDFVYVNRDGKEVPPYIEVIKYEADRVYLVCISFINKEGKLETYADKNALAQRATGNLVKITDTNSDGEKFQKKSRETPATGPRPKIWT